MKFTEGYWLRSERANGLFATQAYAVDKIPGGYADRSADRCDQSQR